MKTTLLLIPTMICLCSVGCSDTVQVNVADTIYFGGDIITMSDKQLNVEAVAVRDGLIIATGTLKQINRAKADNTKSVDLRGRTMLPGFIDAHGHLMAVGIQASSANLLPAPDGDVSDISSLQAKMIEYAKQGSFVKSLGIVLGMGYDQALLAERRHPTRDDLDEVSQDLPVIAVHQSGHLGAVNSKALEILGWTKDTIDPDGGVIRRRSDGEPDGVLEEAAIFMALFPIIESLSPGQNVTLLEIGQRAYVKFGFTTAQEGRALPAQVAALRNASEQNRLVIDVVAYPDVFGAAEVMSSNIPARDYQQHFRIGGGKISLDGSPQGKTAWLSKPYFHPPEGQDSSYVGYPAASDTTVEEKIADAQARGIQILAHVNGDAAADQLISAVTKAIGQHGKHDHRHVAIHSQVLREDQLDAFMALGIIPSFFSLHTFYWGDWHRDETLGPERASRISPANSAIARDMIFTAHHDAPVGLPSSIMIIASLVNRTTRSGKVLGAEQRISVLDALRSITSHAAYQYHEEHNKGSIEAGKLADFVILDKNPLKVSSEELWNLKVLQTIKEDQTVFQSL